MVKNEEAFAKLYLKYSVIFNADSAFWLQISKEEIRHAQWLKTLADSADITVLKPDAYTISIIKNLGEMVEKEIESKEQITLEEALEKTLDFEKAFIEKNYFDIFSENSAKAFRVMEKVKKETKEHIFEIMEQIKLLY